MAKSTNPKLEALATQLVELSTTIPRKTSKTVRENAMRVARGHLDTERKRLEAGFDLWADEGVLLGQPSEAVDFWRRYNDTIADIHSRINEIGPGKDDYYRADFNINRLSLYEFLSGHRYGVASKLKAKLRAAVPGYAREKAKLDKQLAELQTIQESTRAAIFRTYPKKADPVLENRQLCEAVGAITRAVIGLPALAAPAAQDVDVVMPDIDLPDGLQLFNP